MCLNCLMAGLLGLMTGLLVAGTALTNGAHSRNTGLHTGEGEEMTQIFIGKSTRYRMFHTGRPSET